MPQPRPCQISSPLKMACIYIYIYICIKGQSWQSPGLPKKIRKKTNTSKLII